MTRARIEEIEARLGAATPGPYVRIPLSNPSRGVFHPYVRADGKTVREPPSYTPLCWAKEEDEPGDHDVEYRNGLADEDFHAHSWADIRFLLDALRDARGGADRLCEASRKLMNETFAALGFEGSMREAIGNTNYACLERRAREMERVLSVPPEKEAPI